MKTSPALLIVLATLLLISCMSTGQPEDETALSVRAREIWEHNMTIVDRSVEFWKKKQPGTAPYGAEELTNAIDFFETLTKIRGANLSFIGPIPDEQLEKASAAWKLGTQRWNSPFLSRHDPSLRRLRQA
jgi:hypothetical protein